MIALLEAWVIRYYPDNITTITQIKTAFLQHTAHVWYLAHANMNEVVYQFYA